MRYELEKISQIHVELTNKCNAACPTCPRNQYGVFHEASAGNLREYSLQDFKDIFEGSGALYHTHQVMYCGNYGDPAMTKDLLPILEWVFEQPQNPGKAYRTQRFNTNGGMRGTKFWSDVGRLMTEENKSEVIWSIDGLEDTNHLFRRQVVWSKVMNNLEAFMAAGGRGIWEFIEWGHNKHQVEEAREIAKSLGMEFLVKRALGFDFSAGGNGERGSIPVYDREHNYEYSLLSSIDSEGRTGTLIDEECITSAPDGNGNYKEHYEATVDGWTWHQDWPMSEKEEQWTNEQTVRCRSFGTHDLYGDTYPDFHSIYLGSDGIVYPCCYVHGQIIAAPYNSSTKQMIDRFKDRRHHFDTKTHKLDDIILGDEMYDMWHAHHCSKISDGKLLYCADTCAYNSPINQLYHAHEEKSVTREEKGDVFELFAKAKAGEFDKPQTVKIIGEAPAGMEPNE